MSDYNPTPQQEKAIREYLHKSIVPLIEQVLVKKLGQAMSYAAQELVNPKREWVGLTDEERHEIREWQRIQEELGPVWSPMMMYLYLAIEAKLKEKNHG